VKNGGLDEIESYAFGLGHDHPSFRILF